MANPEHIYKLNKGAGAWNRWRNANPRVVPDLSSANLRGKNLAKVNLTDANLRGADLRKVRMSGAKLNGIFLTGADIREADLHGATLINANLREADLRGADLHSAILNGATLREARLSGTDLHEAQLCEANLRQAVLVRTNLSRANISGCSVYGVSAWEVDLADASQTNLRITRPDQPTITVDDLEVAQLIFLLLNYSKLRTVINSITERGVLILGRFGDGGLSTLHFIAEKLRQLKYLPIMFDFDRPKDRDFTETVKTLVGLSRFVIVDLSGPSVPQELYSTVPHFKVPFVPIIQKDRKIYSMFTDLMGYPWVLAPFEFSGTAELSDLIPTIVIRAEEKLIERKALLEKIFPDI